MFKFRNSFDVADLGSAELFGRYPNLARLSERPYGRLALRKLSRANRVLVLSLPARHAEHRVRPRARPAGRLRFRARELGMKHILKQVKSAVVENLDQSSKRTRPSCYVKNGDNLRVALPGPHSQVVYRASKSVRPSTADLSCSSCNKNVHLQLLFCRTTRW